MRYLLPIVAAAILCGCAMNYTARGKAPTATWTLQLPIDEATRCVINGLDAQFATPSYRVIVTVTHAAQITDPGRVYEIKPQQSLAEGVGDEIYFVRVTSEGRNSKVETFTVPNATDLVSAGVTRCTDSLKK